MYAAGGPLSLVFIRRKIGPSAPEDPPTNVELPVITGNPDVNYPLAVTTGIWLGEPGEYRWQWLRNGDPIDGANNLTYALAEEDVTRFVACAVTAINEFGEAAAVSAPVGPIVGVGPANTGVPSITGTAQVGATLTAAPGTWTAVPAPALAIQWKNAGSNIAGATATTYTLQPSDLGALITVQVVATNSAGSANATSAAVGMVSPSDDATAPVLSGFSVDPDGETHASLSVTTDEGNGTFHWVIVPDGATAPSAAQVRAGTDGSGNPAVSSGSVLVSSIDTYGNNPAGLSAGTVYDAYGAMYDAGGNASNVVTDQFTTAGSSIPTLSAAAVADFADIFVWFKATTNNGNGSYFAAVCPAAATPPTGAQIEAGTDGSGNPVPHASLAITTTGEHFIQVRGLTAATAYKVYVVHKVGAYSNIVNAAFSSDIFVVALATTGATTGLAGPGSVYTANQSDPYGGTTAVRWADSNDSATTAFVSLAPSVAVNFGSGVIKVHFSEKWVSGADWRRVSPMTNVDGAALSTHWHATDGAQGYNVGYLGSLPVIRAIGGGWFSFSTSKTLAGPDTSGAFAYSKAQVDNNASVSVRNGTHVSLIHDVRITRAA